MNFVIEKLVLKVYQNRSRNNEVIIFLNIWYTNDDCLNFCPPKPQICEFLGYSKTDILVNDEKSNDVYPIDICLTVLDISGGGGGGEYAPLTS